MDQPNVVVCLCDQLRSFDVGCYGNPVIRTPNIDRLASDGVRFDTAVSNAPVCVPARSCLLTGQYSRTCTGEVNNCADDPPSPRRTRLVDPTLPERFKAVGYDTAAIGKWHVFTHPNLVGFDYALYPLIPHRHYGQTYFEDRAPGFVVDQFAPDFEMARVNEYIRSHRDRPFFLYYNISQPHMPLGPGNAPDRYLTMYDRDEIPMRPNVFRDGRMVSDDRWFKTYTIWDYFWRRHDLATDRLADGFDLRDLAAYYYGMVTCVDDQVGQLMESLSHHGLADNTIVVFVSDHGEMMGSHHMFNKGCLEEEAVRIPMLLRAPGRVRPSANTKHLATLIDVMPTVLELCGLDVPQTVQGRSLMPILRGERETVGDNVAFIETGGLHIGIRTPTHKYGMALSPDRTAIANGRVCFYDLSADPYEERNLADTGKQSDVADDLRARLMSWHESTPWLAVEDGKFVHPVFRNLWAPEESQ